MARARFLRPEFFIDEKLGDLPFGARLLFAGIWCQSDLRGVFEYSPKQLRVLVFPHDEGMAGRQVEEWLEMMTANGMVARFESSGKSWGVIVHWREHQEISTREVEIGSGRPVPPGWVDPERWAEIVCNGKKSKRIGGRTFWNVPEPFQNPTATAAATATATAAAASDDTCAAPRAPVLDSGQDPGRPDDKGASIRSFLEGLGAITRKSGQDLLTEWKSACKGLGSPAIASLFKEARPGIQWPSELKAYRRDRQI